MSDDFRFRWLATRLPDVEQRRLAVLTGARQTGKTTLARHCYPDLRYLNLDDLELRASLRELRTAAWASSVGHAILDEAQKEPDVFEKVKYAFDAGEVDFTLLLGSSRFLLLSKVRETLAGRAFLYDLWPLMLSELAWSQSTSPPRPLLDELLESDDDLATILAKQPEIVLGEEEEARLSAWEHLGRWGGMPELPGLDEADRRLWLRSYQQTFLERDLADLVRLDDLQPFRKLQQLAMLRTGEVLSYAELARDAQLSASTARRYLHYLDLSYQVAILQPYARNLTSRPVKTPKLYWMDLGLLRQTTSQWGPLTGAQFETLVVAETVKWISTMAKDAELSFYRTHSGREVDLLIRTEAGIVGIEIKQRSSVSNRDAKGLFAIARALGDEWRGGLVVYGGGHLVSLDEDFDIWAMPAHRLF